WDPATGRELHTPTEHARAVSALAFSPDGNTLASAAGGFSAERKKLPGEVKFWDATAGTRAGSLPDRPDGVTSLAYTPDGATLVTASGPDGDVQLWDVTTQQIRAIFKGPPHKAHCVALDRAGKRLAAGCLDGTV